MSDLRQIRGESVSLIHYARAQIMETVRVGPEGPALVGKEKGRAGRYETAATSLLKAAWTLRGKPPGETI